MSGELRSSVGIIGMTLGLVVTYVVLGMISLSLAVPRGYASPVFPAAGLALLAFLLLGRRAWFGIWLGSFLLNLWLAYSIDMSVSISGAVVAGIIASGVWLQAMAGELLVRWRIPDVRQLCSTQDLFWLLLLGGPVACLVAATVGTIALHFGHAISPLEWLQSWGTWWVGDTIGVLVVTPLMLMFRPGTAPAWRRRRIPMLIALSVTLALVGFSVVSVSQREGARVKADFVRRSIMVEQVLVARLYGYEEYVNAVGQYVSVTAELDSEAFTNFVKDLYLRYPGIRAMSWVPEVTSEQRESFENHYSSPLRAYHIRELGPQGQLLPAGQRQRYFPVLLIAPARGNEAAVGLDLASEQQRRAAIVRAVDDGRMRATGRLQLVQLDASSGGVLLAHPVFAGDGQLRGVVTAVFSLLQMTDPARALSARLGIAAELSDVTAEQQAVILMDRVLPLAKHVPDQLLHSAMIDWGGRKYLLSSGPSDAYIASLNNWGIWLMMACGLLLASLMEAMVLAYPAANSGDANREPSLGQRLSADAALESDAR